MRIRYWQIVCTVPILADTLHDYSLSKARGAREWREVVAAALARSSGRAFANAEAFQFELLQQRNQM